MARGLRLVEAAWLMALGVLAGCTHGASEPVQIPTNSSTARVQPPAALSRADAVDVDGFVGMQPEGLALRGVPMHVTADGQVVEQLIRRQAFLGFALLDLRTGQHIRIYTETNRTLQPIWVTSTAQYIVWTAAHGETLSTADWRMMRYDRNTQAVREIARFEPGPDGPIPAPDVQPRAWAGGVAYSAAVHRPGRGVELTAYMLRWRETRPTLLKHNAAGPVVAPPYVFYRQRVGSDASLKRQDIHTGQVMTLADKNVLDLAGTSSNLVWVGRNNGPVHILNDDGNQIALYRPPPQSYPVLPVAGDGIVGWTDHNGGAFTYDLERGQLVRLGNVRNGNRILMNGRFVLWAESRNKNSPTGTTFRFLEWPAR